MTALGWFSIAWAAAASTITNLVLLWWTLRARNHEWPCGSAAPVSGPPVTVIRPLRGRESDAFENHRRLVLQRYDPLDVVLATGTDDDNSQIAASIASTAMPSRVRVIGVDPTKAGLSDKGRKMVAAWATTANPFIAFSDSDLQIEPDAIARCMKPFEDPKVGAVFAHCIVMAEGILGRLSMLTIAADGYAFLLGTARSHRAMFLEGGLMVLRRSAVESAGGIGIVANAIGDDTRLGRALRKAGFTLGLADFVLLHRTSHTSPFSWAAQYRRWMMCHRAEASPGFYAALILNPTAIPAIVMLLGPHDCRALALCVLSISAASRLSITLAMDLLLLRRHEVRLGWWVLCKPIADLLHFTFCLSVLVAPWVHWRGTKYWVKANGDISMSSERNRPRPMQPTPVADA